MKLRWSNYNKFSGHDLLEMLKRIERAYKIVQSNDRIPVIYEKGSGQNQFCVQSSSDHRKLYDVDTESKTCTCPDFSFRSIRCKHLIAVEFLFSKPKS
jgi:hypothetical protein